LCNDIRQSNAERNFTAAFATLVKPHLYAVKRVIVIRSMLDFITYNVTRFRHGGELASQ